MIQSNWHVITGAPSSGKTTLIQCLADEGYTIAPEIARTCIENFLAHQHTLEDLEGHNQILQRGILAQALQRERHLPIEQLIFFDRGTVDSLGYFNYYGLKAPGSHRSCQHWKYKKVFYCQPLPVVHDEIRVENNRTAKKIGAYIHEAYAALGYELIELPALPVEERIHIILNYLGG